MGKLRKMASLSLVICLPKFGHAGAAIARRNTWNPRLFVASNPRLIQASSNPEASSAATDALKQGANDAKKTGDKVTQKTKYMAGMMSATAKDAAQKAKDTVLGKAEESKECIKENAETVKES